MDRFRFRIWDIGNKEYCQGDADCCFIEPSGKLTCCFYVDDGYAGRTEHLENFVIEQSTGLKDKNGTLIYEGDILHRLSGRHKRVVWHSAAWKLRNGLSHTDFFEPYEEEIIGNIHENPELLEEQ